MVGLQLSDEVELNLSLNSISCPSSLVLRELDWQSGSMKWSRRETVRSLEAAQVCNSTNISLAVRSVCCIT